MAVTAMSFVGAKACADKDNGLQLSFEPAGPVSKSVEGYDLICQYLLRVEKLLMQTAMRLQYGFLDTKLDQLLKNQKQPVAGKIGVRVVQPTPATAASEPKADKRKEGKAKGVEAVKKVATTGEQGKTSKRSSRPTANEKVTSVRRYGEVVQGGTGRYIKVHGGTGRYIEVQAGV